MGAGGGVWGGREGAETVEVLTDELQETLENPNQLQQEKCSECPSVVFSFLK